MFKFLWQQLAPMQLLCLLWLYLASLGGAGAQARPAAPTLALLPQPVRVVVRGPAFALSSRTTVRTGRGLGPRGAALFGQYVRARCHLALGSQPAAGAASRIDLQLDSAAVPQREGYHLVVGPGRITLTGHDEAGVFYGLQTLSQLLGAGGRTAEVRLPGCEITDYPRFAYRGLHLDVSRHLFPVSDLKKWLDVLAFYKLNTFHWHLTDDQGWRLEIKKYPCLQTVAAYRTETLIGHKKELPHRFDGTRYGGYYTQAEARELVRYAAERHITVIPEIEMPGHALAALSAYPALGCTGGPYQAATFWGVFDDVYCAGNEETFAFLTGVLDEVIAIFPGRYVHIGGDECPKTRWKVCPKCQARLKAEHLHDEHELQGYFVQRIGRYLASKNRQLLGWDEILEGGLSPGATVMSWTGEQGGIEAARLGHSVVMTPEKEVYLDYYQSLNPHDSLAAGGYTPLRKLYRYEPVPAVLTAAQARYVRGVQANVWTEYMPTARKLEYMVFPRLLALAEIAWSPRGPRDYPGFLARVRAHDPLLRALGVVPARNYDEVTDSLRAGPGGLPQLRLQSSAPRGDLRFTLDGQEPTNQSTKYTGPLLITKSCVVKASVFEGPRRTQPVYSKAFTVGPATGKAVALANPPSGNYNPGTTWGLVNGAAGTSRYNDGQWYGFSGTDLVATLDLGAPQLLSRVGTNVLNYHWQKMWAPTKLVFSVSSDGVNYQPVYQQTEFSVNGINQVRARITPVSARYIKVEARNQGVIPAGEYGAGGKAWLLVDELLVNY